MNDFLDEKRECETSLDLALDWNEMFDMEDSLHGTHTDSLADALILSLSTRGRVDMDYIVSVAGVDYYTAINTLRGSIYQNPETWEESITDGWETADEYLSGNLMRKWKAAKEANEIYNGYFSDNLAAIEKVLPPTVAARDIYVTLGSPWVPADIIDDFISHLFGSVPYLYFFGSGGWQVLDGYKTKHDELTGTWEIPHKSRYNHSISVRQTYGTDKMEALVILEHTLNMKTAVVTKEIDCPTNKSGKKRVIDRAETVAAIEKQQKLMQAFQNWVWTDEARKHRLTEIFENKFSCVRRRVFDGSFLEFPTMSDAIKLYPYQKDAVARILFTPNTLLAHDVGAGKTYVMVAAGQELRRMGLSKKNLYVVPNNIIGQWRDIFLMMYPEANILCVDPKIFTPDKRDAVLKRMRDEDFDGIIIAYSCFEQIPLSRKYYIRELREEKQRLEERIKQKANVSGKLKRMRDKVSEQLGELSVAPDDTYNSVYFDELGITRMFVDEAHNFKNVPIQTKTNMVLGINSAGSKKCKAMMDKVHMIQRENDGKGIVFATGTPITNSVTDVYVMQQYLQSGELAMLDLQSFDSWIGMFAERVTEFEIDVDTSSYRLATRFASFHNLPELTALLSSIADFHQMDETAGIPKVDGYDDVLVPKSAAFSAYLQEISKRAEDVRQGIVSRKDDNMLLITTDGRKAALDMRLVDPAVTYSAKTKVTECAKKVADIYFQTGMEKSAQLIFCDTSTPKDGFNIYDELKERLIYYGIPADEIAYIHDAKTEAKRKQLFRQVRTGEIRILIGSTFKLGLGVNVQDRLIALHHIDVPWRPADMTQREGRILRQGNLNPKVQIFRYITEGSFDAYSWQLLETKQRFICGLLSGSLTERSGADIEDTVLNYAEVKALAVGNPMVRERVEAANELSRYSTLQKKLVDSKIRMEKELLELPGLIAHQRDILQNCKLDMAFLSSWKNENKPAEDSKGKKEEAERRKEIRNQLAEALQEHVLETKEIPVMRYRGFQVSVPAYMTKEKRSLWLFRKGKYRVEIGNSEGGILVRMDHFLDSFSEYMKKQESVLDKFETREREIRAELAKNESYEETIKQYKEKVAQIDIALGVEQHE